MRGCFYLHHPNLSNDRCTYQVSHPCGSGQKACSDFRCGSAAQSLNGHDFEFFLGGEGSRRDSLICQLMINRSSPKEVHQCFTVSRGVRTEREREREEPQSAVSVIQPLSESIHTSTHHLTFFHFQVLRVSGACSLMLFKVAW